MSPVSSLSRPTNVPVRRIAGFVVCPGIQRFYQRRVLVILCYCVPVYSRESILRSRRKQRTCDQRQFGRNEMRYPVICRRFCYRVVLEHRQRGQLLPWSRLWLGYDHICYVVPRHIVRVSFFDIFFFFLSPKSYTMITSYACT